MDAMREDYYRGIAWTVQYAIQGNRVSRVKPAPPNWLRVHERLCWLFGLGLVPSALWDHLGGFALLLVLHGFNMLAWWVRVK